MTFIIVTEEDLCFRGHKVSKISCDQKKSAKLEVLSLLINFRLLFSWLLQNPRQFVPLKLKR